MAPARLAAERMLRAFDGLTPSPEILDAIAGRRLAGVTLFRARNVGSPAQVRDLTAALQAARPPGEPPLLIAADQEGGQLQAIGEGATAWPGNLALAAAGEEELAEAAAAAIGRELAAMGINVAYAPVCDLLSDGSSLMGTRTFGDEPLLAARFVSASVRGFAAAGVAATLKHFPGHGAVDQDSHYVLPVSTVDGATLRARELVPFAEGIRAGAELVMLGHLVVPAVTAGREVAAPFTEIAEGLLRDELGFRGVSISDALDMGALGALEDLPDNAVAIVAAGVDLLLTVHEPRLVDEAVARIAAAYTDGRLDIGGCEASSARVRALRVRLGARAEVPALEVVGCAEHASLALEIAERAVTRVRDDAGLIPLRPPASAHPVIVAPAPADLTPADTSSYTRMSLADAVRERGFAVDELEMPMDPDPGAISALRGRLAAAPTAIVGTVDAVTHGGQAALVNALVADGVPTIAVALRTPFDLAAYPSVQTYACSYGIGAPNLRALADALIGRIPFRGHLPVRLEPALETAAR